MPYGDKTGPLGQGPRTGRGLGFCNGYDSPGYTKGIPAGRGYGFGYGRGAGWGGRGFGWGRGFGYGRGAGWGRAAVGYDARTAPTNYASVDEKKLLEDELKYLSERMASLKNRLEDLNKDE